MRRTDSFRTVRRSLGLASIVALLSAPIAWAGVEPTPFRTGLFGVTAEQGVRISVLNAGNARGIIQPCVHVWDAAGNLLFESDGGPLPGGVGTSFVFEPVVPPSGVPSRGGVQLLRVEVELEPVPDDSQPIPDDGIGLVRLFRSVIPTLEVFDLATGQTVYTSPFAAVAGIEPTPFAPVAGVEPQPFAPVAGIDPQPFRTGLFGVTAGQGVRISGLNAGEARGGINPCFEVWDAAGNLLFEMNGGPLPSGIGTAVEFEPTVPPSGVPSRGGVQMLRVEVEVESVRAADGGVALGTLLRSVIPSLEVFDLATGRTEYTMPWVLVGFNPQPEPPVPSQPGR